MALRYNGNEFDWDGDVYEGTHPVFIRPRRGVPIKYWRHWHRSPVGNVSSVTDTSVAARYNPLFSDRVFIAYVSNGTLIVKSADITELVTDMDWQIEEQIEGCSKCALAFDGTFNYVGDVIEFYTDQSPYLFYTTSSGELKCGVLGDSYTTIVGANVGSFDAVRAVKSRSGDEDQGLLVFYEINGSVYLRPYVNGVWDTQQTAYSVAETTIVDVKAERTFDWRICLQLKDNSGNLLEVFSQPYYSGHINVEFLTAKATALSISVKEIEYESYQAPDEYITARPSGMAIAVKAAVTSPYIADAWNVPVSMFNEETEEWYDDYGYNVVVKWSDAVYGFEDNLDKIYIEDDYGMKWYAQEITRLDPPNRLLVRFINMNNAGNPVTINYDGSGTMTSGVIPVTGCSKSFSLTGLVPYYVDSPVFVSAWNDGSQTIYIEFDKPIINIASQSGFVLSGFEPDMSPEGELVSTTYGFDSVDHADALTVYTDGLDGSMTNVENVDGAIQLEVDA